MAITIIVRKEEHQIDGKMTVKQAFESLKLSPESHLAVRAGVLLTEDEVLHDGDVVKVVPVISGGASC